MDITYLKALYITAKCKSISVAAKQLHLSQPGLSFQLQSLESSIGKTLLSRSNKGVTLTEEGEIVFKYAESIIDIEEKMHKELEQLENKSNELTIAACTSLADYSLPCSAYTFKEIHDNIDINILSMSSCDVVRKLREKEINIGIIQSLEDIDDIIQTPIIDSDVSLVCSGNIQTSSLDIDDLPSIPIITREGNAIINRSLSKDFEGYGKNFKDFNILFTLNSDEAIKRTLMCRDVYAFLPEIVIKHEVHDRYLKKVFVKGLELKSSYALVYRKDYALSDFEKTFIKFITSSHRCFCY